MNDYLFDCPSYPSYPPTSAFSQTPSTLTMPSANDNYDAGDLGLHYEGTRFESVPGYLTSFASSSEALPTMFSGYPQQAAQSKQYPGASVSSSFNYTYAYDSQGPALGLAVDLDMGLALGDEYDPFGFNTSVSMPNLAFGSPAPSSASSISPRSSISSASSSELANYDGHIGSNAPSPYWSDSSSSCSSSPTLNDRALLPAASYSQGQIYAPQPVHPQVQSSPSINMTTSLRLVESKAFPESHLHLQSQPHSRPSTGASSSSYSHRHQRRSEPYALAPSLSRARHGVHPVQPINAQYTSAGKSKPSATETPAGIALTEKERKERERAERRRSKDGRVKAYRCPRVGCTKAYLNPNGLKYHLEKGTCTIDPAFISVSAVLPSQASVTASCPSSQASSPATSSPAPGLAKDAPLTV